MRPLSPAYLEELIIAVIMGLKHDDREDLKNLVLSCREMSNTFEVVMQNVFVYYSYRCTRFGLSSEYNRPFDVTHTECNWVAPFVSKLTIDHYADDYEISFFERVYSFERIKELDFANMDEDNYRLDTIHKLMSISPKLTVNVESLRKIRRYLYRYDTVVFNPSDNEDDLKLFRNTTNADSSAILELYFCYGMPMFSDVLNSFEAQFEDVERFYFFWNDLEDFPDFVKCLAALPRQLLHVGVYLKVLSYNGQKYVVDGTTVTHFWKSLKDDLDGVISIMRKTPPHIKVNMVFHRKNLQFEDHCGGEKAFLPIAHYFPPEDFIVTSDDRSRSIVNRQKKLTENVEFLYQLDVESIDEVFED